MDNENLIKQLLKEGKNVPDNRKKIINAAKAEGLLTDNSLDTAAVYNGGGTAAAVKGNRIIAAVASVLVLGTVAAAAIVPAVSGNNGSPSIPAIPSSPVLCSEELGKDYAIGAVSTAKLLGSFGIAGAENGGATATPASFRRDAITVQAPDVETQINNFGTYFGAFGTFFGAGEELVTVSESPDKYEKYPNSVVISGKYANGDKAEYAMHYIEALDIENSTDSEEIYYLEGAIFIDEVHYYLEGWRTFSAKDSGAEAYDLELYAYPSAADRDNKDNYVQMTLEYREVNGGYTKYYNYCAFSGGNKLSETLTFLPSFEDEAAFNLTINYGGDGGSFVVARPEAGQPIVSIDYNNAELGAKAVSFKVSQTQNEAISILMNSFLYDLIESDKTCTIKGYKADETMPEGILEIPESIVVKNNVYTVTAIGSSAFYNRSEIKKVVIPPTVKTIGSGSFASCANLEEVEFNEGLQSIDNSFYSCTSLKSIAIPASVTSISGSAFRFCSGLESISVAEGNKDYSGAGNCLVNSLGWLLQGCASSVIPDDGSVCEIEAYAFYRTKIKTVYIPESVRLINDFAFEYCTELEEVVVTGNVGTIYQYAFAYCTQLNKITLPDTGISIKNNVFYNTGYENDKNKWSIENGYEALYIGKHLIRLTPTATDFYPDIVIKTGTLTIADQAFDYDVFGYNKTLVGSVTLNTELLLIGYAPHIGGRGCKSISFAYGNTTNVNGKYYVEGNCLIARETCEIIAGCDNSVIPEDANLNCIAEYAFAECKFENIIIPNNIYKIGFRAFSGCINLSEITIPGNVYLIDMYAFYNCEALKKVEFANDRDNDAFGLTLDVECFAYCVSLESIELPYYTTVLRSAFSHCIGLTDLNIYYNDFLEIGNLAAGCQFLRVCFQGTSEQWLRICKDDVENITYSVYCMGDGVLIEPVIH